MPSELTNRKNKLERTTFCNKCDKFALVEGAQLHCSTCGSDLVEWH